MKFREVFFKKLQMKNMVISKRKWTFIFSYLITEMHTFSFRGKATQQLQSIFICKCKQELNKKTRSNIVIKQIQRWESQQITACSMYNQAKLFLWIQLPKKEFCRQLVNTVLFLASQENLTNICNQNNTEKGKFSMMDKKLKDYFYPLRRDYCSPFDRRYKPA